MQRCPGEVPSGFTGPTSLPQTTEERDQWQEKNRAWWEHHPMRYDWRDHLGLEEFTNEFYAEIDRRFFSCVRHYMPWDAVPFDPLLDFPSLSGKEVLEVGVGTGSHAQLLAQYARSFTGIDLTDYAVKSTAKRMQLRRLPAAIVRMDAEDMAFRDHTFDLIWSWGVIHHSADPSRILREMHRVLKPGGRAVTMVYHRSLWSYYVVCGLLHGVLRGELLRTRSLHRTVQSVTDGSMARYYTVPEWRELVSNEFQVERILIYGSKEEIVPLPRGPWKQWALHSIPDSFARLLTNRLKMGWFLVSVLRRRPEE